jgi:hypothetical protein
MQAEIARPGVQHHRDAELGPQARLPELDERGARRREERRVDELRPETREAAQLAGQREDDVKVPHR